MNANNENQVSEVFKYCGDHEFDVAMAIEQIGRGQIPLVVRELPVKEWAESVLGVQHCQRDSMGEPVSPEEAGIVGIVIDQKAAMEMPESVAAVPGIVVMLPTSSGGKVAVLIDGHHRLFRAHVTGSTMLAYLIDDEAAILTFYHHSPQVKSLFAENMENPVSKSKQLGEQKITNRGFPVIEFKDHYNNPCALQASSLAIYQQPGTSAIWLGVTDAQPVVMASVAAEVGVETDETAGWVPYPIPPQVLLHTQMHLNRDQVAALVGHLQAWLNSEDGQFVPCDNTQSDQDGHLAAAAPDLLAACVEFVRKCEAGEARSKRSYARMKAAIAKATGDN